MTLSANTCHLLAKSVMQTRNNVNLQSKSCVVLNMCGAVVRQNFYYEGYGLCRTFSSFTTTR